LNDLYQRCINVKSHEEAAKLLILLTVRNISITGNSFKKAIEIEKYNISYFAGYFDNSTRFYVEFMFECKHPIFGSIMTNGTPTKEEAFELGIRLGRGESITLRDLRRERNALQYRNWHQINEII